MIFVLCLLDGGKLFYENLLHKYYDNNGNIGHSLKCKFENGTINKYNC